jgi:hypothetical protein
MLREMEIGQQWGIVMMTTGAYLIFGSIFNRRDSLAVGMFLCAMVWTIMSILLFNNWWLEYPYPKPVWITPITMSMPVFALILWVALLRELLVCPMWVRDRRSGR